MKTPTHESPRLTCRVARTALAILGDTTGATPRGPGASHVAACADCQAFFSAADELGLALTRAAAHAWHEAPANLEQDILRAVRQDVAETSRLSSDSGKSAAPRVAVWSLTAAVACATLAVVALQDRFVSARSTTVTATATTPTTAPAVAADNNPSVFDLASRLVAAVPTDLFDEVSPKALAVWRQDTLQDEFEAVKADARTAVRILAMNFLPTAADGQ